MNPLLINSLRLTARYAGLQRNYEKFRRDGRLPATFEVVYGHAEVNQKQMKTAGRKIIQIQIQRK